MVVVLVAVGAPEARRRPWQALKLGVASAAAARGHVPCDVAVPTALRQAVAKAARAWYRRAARVPFVAGGAPIARATGVPRVAVARTPRGRYRRADHIAVVAAHAVRTWHFCLTEISFIAVVATAAAGLDRARCGSVLAVERARHRGCRCGRRCRLSANACCNNLRSRALERTKKRRSGERRQSVAIIANVRDNLICTADHKRQHHPHCSADSSSEADDDVRSHS